MNRKLVPSLLPLIIIIVASCTTVKMIRSNPPDGLIQDSLVVYKAIESKNKYSYHGERNEVGLMFFQTFNDTVTVYLDGNKDWSGYINEINNPSTSSGYSGITVKINSKRKVKNVTIELVQQKRYISFHTFNRYHLYTVQKILNVWYINGRKNYPILK